MVRSTDSGSTSIQQALAADHRRLQQLLDRLVTATWSGDPCAAGTGRELAAGLARHIRWEEEHLFPALLSDIPRDLRRSVDVLRADHHMLRELLDLVVSALSRPDFDRAKPLLEEFSYQMAGHDEDEERGALRDADRGLEGGERMQLIARFHELAAAGTPAGGRP